jgi:hypothetical protein
MVSVAPSVVSTVVMTVTDVVEGSLVVVDASDEVVVEDSPSPVSAGPSEVVVVDADADVESSPLPVSVGVGSEASGVVVVGSEVNGGVVVDWPSPVGSESAVLVVEAELSPSP